MSQLKRYNGSSWEIVGGMPTGDTLPIGSEVNYNGDSVPAGWEEINDPVLIPTVLYNSTGTSSTAVLDDTVANYDYIEIYYKTNDNDTISSKKIYPINTSSIVCLDFSYEYGGTVYHKIANVEVNGTNITFLCNKEFVNFGTNGSGNYIFITRVVGYK